MIVQAQTKLFISCPSCMEKEFRVDHLSIKQTAGPWGCDHCHNHFHVKRLSISDFQLDEAKGEKSTPVTVTLKSVTEPPIILKLNAWKYPHSQKDTKEEYAEHEEYFYNEHTCPTNWTNQIEQIIFQGNTDPHGVFQFVSVEDGHFKDSNVY